MAILLEIAPLDPATGLRMPLRFSASDDLRTTSLNGQRWWPGIVAAPNLQMEGSTGGFGEAAVLASASLGLDPIALRRADPASPAYRWPGSPVTIYEGQPGAPWSAWVERFVGLVTDYSTDANARLSLSAQVDGEPFEAALLGISYAGLGGASGSTDLRDKPRPMVFGRARGVEPVLINATDNVYQVHGYGPIEAITAVYERAAEFVENGGEAVGDFATYAALVAADIAEGSYGTCLAEGLFRLGAPPAGLISADVLGDNSGGFHRSTAAVIRRMCALTGVDPLRLDADSLNALELAVPYPINVYVTQPTKLIDIIQALVRPCNAQAIISWTGQLRVIRFGAIPAATISLDGQGRALPAVTSVTETKTSPPYGRIEMRGDRCWRPHTKDEIAYLDSDAAAAYAAATSAQETADAAAAIIASLSDDGALSINEKITKLIPRDADLDAAWAVLDSQAAGITLTSVTSARAAAAAGRSAWQTYRNSLSPAWNNISLDTAVTRATYNGKLADYVHAIDLLANALRAYAQSNAALALAQIDTIVADGVLSRDEKPEIIKEYGVIVGEQAALVGQANARGVSPAALQSAQSTLGSYLGSLSPQWNVVTLDTPIDRATFRQRFVDYYNAKIALLAAISEAAAKSALWDSVTGTGKDALVSQAAAAASQATQALSRLTTIASDNVLSIDEKPEVIRTYNAIALEYGGLVSQGGAIGVSTTDYASKKSALDSYLGGLGTGNSAWDSLNGDTTIDGPTFRAKFTDYFTARAALYNAIAQKNNDVATAAAASAASAVSSANATNSAIAVINSDSVLSRNEKPEIIRQIQSFDAEYADTLATAASYPNAVSSSAYVTAYNALKSYLAGLGTGLQAWNNTGGDTAIDPATFATKFADYLAQRQYLLNDIAYAASLWDNTTGTAKPDDNATQGLNLIKSPDKLLRTTYTNGAYANLNAGNSGSNRDRNRAIFPGGGYAYWEPVVGVVKVTPGEYLFAQFDGNAPNGTWRFVVRFYDIGGTDLGAIFVDVSQSGQTWATLGGITFQVPGNAASCQVYTQWFNGSGTAYAANPVLQKVQPGADNTNAQIAAGVADTRIQSYATSAANSAVAPVAARTTTVESKTQQLSTAGQLNTRRGTSPFSLGGAQQVVLVMDQGNPNGVAGSPLTASYNSSTGLCDIQIHPHRIADDAGFIDYNGATLSGIQQNLDVWIFEDGNYAGGLRSYQVTQEPTVIAGYPSPNPNRRLVGAVHTPSAGQAAVTGNGGGGGGVRASPAKYNQANIP